MPVISMKSLLETGVHFGHRTHKWNPRMKPYIFTERNNIHIIDLQQTIRQIDVGYHLVRDTVAAGGKVLFVGTKRQAQEAIQIEANRCGMPSVTNRWLGGMLTNWVTVRDRVRELNRLEKERDTGEWESLTKKERLVLQRLIEKLTERFGGIRSMEVLPKLIFVVDVRREDIAIDEANKLQIPVLAMVDTNCDPTPVDYVIPANDDAIRAIKLLVAKMADAVLEGMAMRKDSGMPLAEESLPMPELGDDDSDLLGASTIAKLRVGRLTEFAEQLVAEGELDLGDDLSLNESVVIPD
jgi:small subunit ribosomal protein S2